MLACFSPNSSIFEGSDLTVRTMSHYGSIRASSSRSYERLSSNCYYYASTPLSPFHWRNITATKHTIHAQNGTTAFSPGFSRPIPVSELLSEKQCQPGCSFNPSVAIRFYPTSLLNAIWITMVRPSAGRGSTAGAPPVPRAINSANRGMYAIQGRHVLELRQA